MIKRLIAIFVLLLTAAACIAVDGAIALSPGQLDQRLRLQASQLLCAPFDFKSVNFSFSEGLRVNGLRIGDPKEPALVIGSVNVRLKLLAQRITEIVIEKPEVHFILRPDGSTNMDNILKPQPERASSEAILPRIEIVHGKITARVELAPGDVIETTLYDIIGLVEPGPGSNLVDISVLLNSDELGGISLDGSFSPGFKTARLDLQDGKPVFEVSAECFDCSARFTAFPVPVEEIKGTVKITPQGVQLAGFSGQTFGNHVSLEGSIEFGKPRLQIKLDIIAKDLKASADLLAVIPEGERKIIEEFAPQGSADISINLRNAADSAMLVPTVRVDVKGNTSIAYFEFPYRLENLRGTLLVTPGKIEIKNVTSIMENQKITCSGLVVPCESGVEMDIRIKGEDISIDERLRKALGDSEREAWDVFNPSGTANLNVSIKSPPDDKKVDLGIEIMLDGFASITPEPFPLQVSNLTGRLSILPEGVMRLSGLRGRVSGGEVAISDTDIPAEKAGSAKIDALFSNVGIGRGVIKALGDAMGENLEDLTAGGSASGNIQLQRPEDSEDFNLTGTVSLKDGWILHKLFPLKAQKLEGTLFIKPGGYYLHSLTGEVADGKLEAWGELLELPGDKQKIRLRVEGFNILADDSLKNSLPEELVSTYNDFEPYGRADAAIWLDGVTPLDNIRKIVRLHLRNLSGKYVEFPYPISGVAGDVRIDVDTGKVDIKGIHTADRTITLSGTVVPQGQRTITDLLINANKIKLDEALCDAMPEEIKTLWKDIELDGAASGTVTLHIDQLGKADPEIQYKVLLRPENARIEAGFPFEKLQGKVKLEGRVSSGGEHTLESGLILLRDFTVTGLPVKWMSAPLKMSGESLTLEPITGKMAGGTVSGVMKVLFDKDTTYSGSFELKDASVRQGATDLFGGEMEKTTGRANAWVRFQGKSSDDSSLRGKGEVKLDKSNLWQVPFFSAVMKAVSAGAIPRVDFSESFAHFRIKGDKLLFSKTQFISSIMKLSGGGTLDLDGNIDFIFRVNLLGSIPFIKLIPVVKEIVQSVEGQFFAIRATGTAKKVTVTVAPAKVLEALKGLEKSEKNKPKNE
jgi:hypothetical protein